MEVGDHTEVVEEALEVVEEALEVEAVSSEVDRVEIWTASSSEKRTSGICQLSKRISITSIRQSPHALMFR